MSKALELQRMTGVDSNILRLVEKELETPVRVIEDKSLRFKVTDSCGMACIFCHNEGTPVANPVQREEHGRVSIYEGVNMVNFIPGSAKPDQSYKIGLLAIRERLQLNELHWTGGEPTLNVHIGELTEEATKLGYVVKMTSNGETGMYRMEELAAAGLESINFSIFGTTPKEISQIQSTRFQDPKYGALKLAKLTAAIESSARFGIRPKANIVIQGEKDYSRVQRVINRFGSLVDIRLLPSLADGMNSITSIYKLLGLLGAEPTRRIIAAGGSNSRTDFELPDGMRIGFKQINRVTLPETCADCTLNNEKYCNEGYYGVRMYIDDKGHYKVGVCIQRMDLTVDLSDFLQSDMPEEIIKFRREEYQRLRVEFANFLDE